MSRYCKLYDVFCFNCVTCLTDWPIPLLTDTKSCFYADITCQLDVFRLMENTNRGHVFLKCLCSCNDIEEYNLYILWRTTSALHMPKSQQCTNLFTGYGYWEIQPSHCYYLCNNLPGAFIYLETSLYELIYNKALTATWSVCETRFLTVLWHFLDKLSYSLCLFFLQPYQHTETHTGRTVATCFLFDLSPSVRVRLGRTPTEQCQGANVLFWYVDSLLCYLSEAFVLLCFYTCCRHCVHCILCHTLGPVSNSRYLYFQYSIPVTP